MADEPTLTDPWLVAAWPGMGSVALAAASYLVAKLDGKPVQTIVRREFFDVTAVAIEGGVVRRPGLPKSTLYAIPGTGRDLLAFVGEAQPSHKGFDFCNEIVDLALGRGVKRIVTFAAMATQIHPGADPRVFGVSSEASLLPMLARHDVAVLAEGQISGLNGVLLASAAERGVEAFCLLGELPFFAINIPNPKASLAVLRAFTRISGVRVDLSEMEEQARLVERGLLELIERASKSQGGEGQASHEDEEKPNIPEAEAPEEPRGPSPATLAKIEDLFSRARADRAQALNLKRELDRMGLFKKFEDRFLDLFKREEHG